MEEDESAMPKKDSRLMLAKFNEQMEKVPTPGDRHSGLVMPCSQQYREGGGAIGTKVYRSCQLFELLRVAAI